MLDVDALSQNTSKLRAAPNRNGKGTMIQRPEKNREMQNHHMDSSIWSDLKFRDDDIVVATYGKTGTTWTQQMIVQMLLGPDANLEPAKLSPWLDMRLLPKEVILPALEAQTHRRVLKTHLPLDALVFSPNAKYLYVGRDGRDIAWSLHNHLYHATDDFYRAINDTPGRIGPPLEPPSHDVHLFWQAWFEGGGYPIWAFWEHVRSWWAYRDLPNIMLLHFDDLKRDMRGQMRRIAAFLDIPVKEAQWEEIVHYCSFEWMKRHADTVSPNGGVGWEDGGQTFINKGTNRRWQQTLTAEEVAAYEERAVRELGEECARWLATGGASTRSS